MRAKPKGITEAKNAIFRLLKIRLRSEHEVRERLKQKGFSSEIIEEATTYFCELDLLNDQHFTQRWIESRLKKPYGFRRIKQELQLKGIAPEIIQSEIDHAAENFVENDIVTELALHRVSKYHGVAPDKIKQRVYAYLVRRGFNSRAITKAVQNLNLS